VCDESSSLFDGIAEFVSFSHSIMTLRTAHLPRGLACLVQEMDQVWTFTTMTIPLEAAWALQPRASQVQTLNSGSGGLFCSTENYRRGGMA